MMNSIFYLQNKSEKKTNHLGVDFSHPYNVSQLANFPGNYASGIVHQKSSNFAGK